MTCRPIFQWSIIFIYNISQMIVCLTKYEINYYAAIQYTIGDVD